MPKSVPVPRPKPKSRGKNKPNPSHRSLLVRGPGIGPFRLVPFLVSLLARLPLLIWAFLFFVVSRGGFIYKAWLMATKPRWLSEWES